MLSEENIFQISAVRVGVCAYMDATLLNCIKVGLLMWLDWIFLGRYLPSLSLNYVGMSKHIEKRLTQLYYIKMKISYDLGFIAIGVAMAT